MDSDDAMVALAASELVGDELDQDHELCLWGDELGKARRRAHMQLLKLAMAACNAIAIAEMESIAAANDIGILAWVAGGGQSGQPGCWAARQPATHARQLDLISKFASY